MRRYVPGEGNGDASAKFALTSLNAHARGLCRQRVPAEMVGGGDMPGSLSGFDVAAQELGHFERFDSDADASEEGLTLVIGKRAIPALH